MRITCSQCGQDLIGAVNRCWKCGKSLPQLLGADGLPKIRRAPVAPTVEAVVIDEHSSSAITISPPLMEGARGGAASENAPVAAQTGSHATSPLAPPVREPATAPLPADADSTPAWRDWSAALGVVAGIVGLATMQLEFWPLGVGLAGVTFGIWGIGTQRNGVGIAAVLLCCAALALATGSLALLVFKWSYGSLPW